MKIDWAKIRDKYPKSFNKIISIKGYRLVFRNKYILDLCYCDIEKFFGDNGIEIIIKRICLDKLYLKKWVIIVNNHLEIVNTNNRQKAKEKAVYKAFEIMEGKK